METFSGYVDAVMLESGWRVKENSFSNKTNTQPAAERRRERETDIANVKLDFFEPPAGPRFVAAGGVSANMLYLTMVANKPPSVKRRSSPTLSA
ncbi:hypothetical protein FHS27_004954 [Rhodopirellula rubra]|uniref:Uncharacterized protein n=1 Tax=Aporhodopirellula rubra TaxID=980271 RepID=A0A7W5E2W4_9BACT|nr:hypothetical protein [Aporhodopirellula rubra]